MKFLFVFPWVCYGCFCNAYAGCNLVLMLSCLSAPACKNQDSGSDCDLAYLN
uniref:Uncharacterized protein n=1 Tax=Rhizophora mucronata TaxID=61149 RepID=A0A2P2L8U2_RHIMU